MLHIKNLFLTNFTTQIKAWLPCLSLLIVFSCTEEKPQVGLNERSLIPMPVSVISQEGTLKITPETTVYISSDDGLQSVVKPFIDQLGIATGFKLDIATLADESPEKGMVFKISDGIEHNEGYRLTVNGEKLTLEAHNAEGIFRGIQTIRQLLPPAVEGRGVAQENWLIPGVAIEDYPLYGYRGSMLDVSRHFFGVEEVKRYIDLMAAFKMNTLHLHLTDDQGWRIEIKSWPKLTEIGGSTEVGGGEGGFYTQEQYKEIVAYAAERYITIIPEIDMPGHTNAALASYPELNCDGKSPKLYTETEVGFSSFCTDKEITYRFIDDVVKELAAMTPGSYIHIGGDESHVTKLEDYIPFVERVQEIVKKHGKKAIGWDEIRHAELADQTVVQFWANEENALEAVKKGAKVLMSPSSKAYMDMKYDSITPLGLSWAGLIDVKTGYDWDPATLVKGIGKDEIIGVEAPLWTETIETMEDVEYMVFPRLLGYAEIGWTQDSLRNWNSYRERLGKQYLRLKQWNINFYESDRIPWKKEGIDSTTYE